ncbi:MAG: hypothetical protein EXX96DRAFT_543967 [Benjaminiella poitrasii]|nr:MAG: hypothetical protein EXX96DRAFT_543967 [Benjaminiella poitrasii]
MKYFNINMVILLATFCAIFIQKAQAFCIYNDFEDETKVEIYQMEMFVAPPLIFSKYISKGKKECCHYTERDCSPRPLNNVRVTFHVRLLYPGHDGESRTLTCFSGGALTFHGEKNHRKITCHHPDGSSSDTQIEESES